MASGLEKFTGPNAAPEKVAGGFGLTAGPVFSRIGYLLFSDAPANRILQWAAGKVTVFREGSNGAAGLTFDHQGRLLACERGRVTRTEKDGTITVLADRCEGRQLIYPHDLVYAIDGSVYFSDPGAANAPDAASRNGLAAVCQVTPKGGVRVVSRDCARPAGVALAPNQQKLYVADAGRNIRVYEIAADGGLRGGRVFAAAAPEGLKTDEEGNVWVADADGITVFDSLGRRLGAAPVPERPGNCAWGEGFHGLYITAGTSVYRLKAAVDGTRTY